MRDVSITVNGESHQIHVADRTQLAEVLRDTLHLTGTHLGCEQGVCGACTVLVNGNPVRSCLMYAASCDNAHVDTVEGFKQDTIMDDLRDAFSRHHALQCGFCTSGMLISAHDIVTRLATPDESQIRQRLSGNLCRCTGYMGIVAAVADVITKHQSNESDTPIPDSRGDTSSHAQAPSPAATKAFKPFDIDPVFKQATIDAAAQANAPSEEGWTRVQHAFLINHGLTTVWALFEDLPRLARCLPGATIESVRDDSFSGTLGIAFGPIRAGFAIDGHRESSAAQHSGEISGHGHDTLSRSRANGTLRYQCDSLSSAQTQVQVTLRFQIQGPLAQFNRPDLVNSFSAHVIRQFADNCQRLLDGNETQMSHELKGVDLVKTLVKQKLGF